MDYDSLRKAGSALGAGSVIVMDETTCMVRMLERISRFYAVESCGQCTPCREGTGWLYRVMGRIRGGTGPPSGIWICCWIWPIRLKGGPYAPWAMPPPGRCRVS